MLARVVRVFKINMTVNILLVMVKYLVLGGKALSCRLVELTFFIFSFSSYTYNKKFIHTSNDKFTKKI